MGICGSSGEGKADAKPGLLFVVGGPGSGKGTQCTKLKAKYGFVHLSTGDILRAELKSGSDKAKEMEKIMNDGGLVSTAMLLELVEAEMRKQGWAKSKFLLDGFPRNKENLEVFGQALADKVNLMGTLFFELDLDTMKDRLLGRNEGRADDNEETIKKRLATYENETVPIVKDMAANAGTVHTINAKQTIDEVSTEVCACIDKLMGKAPAPKKEAPAPKKEAAPAGPVRHAVYFVVGGPGSGKGTQCAIMAKEHGYKHLSTGDLLRAEVATGSEKGQALQKIMSEGGLVTTRDLLELVQKAMAAETVSCTYLLDGFPRNQENVDTWMEMMKDCDMKAILYFDLDNDTMTERLLGRNEGRADDNEETIKKRLATYMNETKPTVKKLHAMNNVHRIGAKDTKENVTASVNALLAKFMAGNFTPENPPLEEYMGDEAPAQEEAPAPEPEAPQEETPQEEAPQEEAPPAEE